MNESSPVPVHIVESFLELNPSSLEELWFKVSVIAICQNKRISGKVLELFLNKGPKQTLKSVVRKSLINQAMLSGNKEVVNVLINNFPWVLSQQLESNNEIPIFYCLKQSPPDVLELVVETGIRHGIEGVGGLFFENRYGETFFFNLIMTLSNDKDRRSRQVKWKKMDICFRYIDREIRKETTQKYYLPSKSPFSSICFLPSHLIDEGIEELKFDVRYEDIFFMIKIATTMKWIRSAEFTTMNTANAIRRILAFMKADVKGIHKGRNDSKLYFDENPLLYAAYRGLEWGGGLKEIMMSDIEALQRPSRTTGLLPFMTAACGSKCELDAIYCLLLSGPSLIEQWNR